MSVKAVNLTTDKAPGACLRFRGISALEYSFLVMVLGGSPLIRKFFEHIDSLKGPDL